MSDFLRFFDSLQYVNAMHLEIYNSEILDWCIKVWKKGVLADGGDLVILNTQSNDMELAFALAHVQLKEWLLEHEGGY